MDFGWEANTTRFSLDDKPFEVCGYPKDFVIATSDDMQNCLNKDVFALPVANDRELYFPNNNGEYWKSGYYDARQILKTAGFTPNKMLDLGCASGRLLRHFAMGLNLETWGCDVNYRHIRWINTHLPELCRVVQISAWPHLPFPDEEFDLVVGLSVFTHQEVLDTAWIAEIRRILAPGGMAYLTAHTENTWNNLSAEHILNKYLVHHKNFRNLRGKPMTQDKLVFRFNSPDCYQSHVFHHTRYIKRAWGSLLPLSEIRLSSSSIEQDVAVFRKPRG
jgi:SAM-dependent methyltransferase